MKVLVLLTGVVDPKWPLVALSEDPAATRAKNRLALSPFDEAALETGLKIRDLAPGTELTVALFGGPESDALLRKVIAYKPNNAHRIDLPQAMPWDTASLARQVGNVINALSDAPDLILIGREFGDYDNGVFPAFLAQELRLPFFGLAQHIVVDHGALKMMREVGSVEETLCVDGALVASVTNDRRNRLRHPLMKNVMDAKRAQINVLSPPHSAVGEVSLKAIGETPPRSRNAECRFLTGPKRAAELAEYLAAWRIKR
jgi:electron transfer flavoprotein beta subunit